MNALLLMLEMLRLWSSSLAGIKNLLVDMGGSDLVMGEGICLFLIGGRVCEMSCLGNMRLSEMEKVYTARIACEI